MYKLNIDAPHANIKSAADLVALADRTLESVQKTFAKFSPPKPTPRGLKSSETNTSSGAPAPKTVAEAIKQHALKKGYV